MLTLCILSSLSPVLRTGFANLVKAKRLLRFGISGLLLYSVVSCDHCCFSLWLPGTVLTVPHIACRWPLICFFLA